MFIHEIQIRPKCSSAYSSEAEPVPFDSVQPDSVQPDSVLPDSVPSAARISASVRSALFCSSPVCGASHRAALLQEQLEEQFGIWVSLAERNGQILENVSMLYWRGEELLLTAGTLEKDSLDLRYETELLRTEREKLESLAAASLEISCVGWNSAVQGVCDCAECAGFILWTHSVDAGSPIMCISCGQNVPLYRLPETVRYPLWNWASAYRKCDWLNMDCGFGECWASRQMREAASGLMREGRALASMLESACGIPVWVYLYNDRSVRRFRARCPVCGKELRRSEDSPLFGGILTAECVPIEFHCPECRLGTNAPF